MANNLVYEMCLTAVDNGDYDFVLPSLCKISRSQKKAVVEKAWNHEKLMLEIAKNAWKWDLDICKDQFKRNEITIANCLARKCFQQPMAQEAAEVVFDTCNGNLHDIELAVEGGNILHVAVFFGNLEFIKSFSELAGSKKMADYCQFLDNVGQNLLHLAVGRNHFEIFKYIYQTSGKNRDLLKRNHMQMSPMYLAGDDEFYNKILEWLLKNDKGISPSLLEQYCPDSISSTVNNQTPTTCTNNKMMRYHGIVQFFQQSREVVEKIKDNHELAIADMFQVFEEFCEYLRLDLNWTFRRWKQDEIEDRDFPIAFQLQPIKLIETYGVLIKTLPIEGGNVLFNCFSDPPKLRVPFDVEDRHWAFLEFKSMDNVFRIYQLCYAMWGTLGLVEQTQLLATEQFTTNDFGIAQPNYDYDGGDVNNEQLLAETVDYFNSLRQQLSDDSNQFQPKYEDIVFCVRFLAKFVKILQLQMKIILESKLMMPLFIANDSLNLDRINNSLW